MYIIIIIILMSSNHYINAEIELSHESKLAIDMVQLIKCETQISIDSNLHIFKGVDSPNLEYLHFTETKISNLILLNRHQNFF